MLRLAASSPVAPQTAASHSARGASKVRLEVLVRAAGVAVAALAAAQVLIYLRVAGQTLAYPYPLEWMEGGSLDVVDRVLRGLPIYARPTPDYVAYLYTPLYFWVTAFVARVVGVDFLAARSVSCAAIVGVAIFIWLFVRRETGGERLYALAAVGTFFGTYEASDRWFHLARVDSLFLMLLLAAFYVLRRGAGVPSAILSGVLLWLSFATKQTALVCAAVALPVMAFDSWRRPAIVAAVLSVLVVGTNVIMGARTEGWWTFFVYGIARDQGFNWHMVYRFWLGDIIKVMPLALVGFAALTAGRDDRRSSIWLLGLFAGLLGTSWLGRANIGGAGNVLMPAYAALAIAMPIGLARLGRTTGTRFGVTLAIALQLTMLLNWPSAAVPTAADRVAGDQFVSFLRGIDGDVMIFSQRFVATRAGKKSFGLEAAANDILASSKIDLKNRFRDDIVLELTSGRVAGVIDPPPFVHRRVKLGRAVNIFPTDAGLWTLSGIPRRPGAYYPVLRHESAR